MNTGFLRLFLILLPLLTFSSLLAAKPYAPSARRAPHEDYRTKITEYSRIMESEGSTSAKSAVNSAVPLADLNLEQMPVWPETENFELYFQNIRDERFITADPEFHRRSTWLFPDDGCYARAALANARTTAQSLPAPGRVFVFGNLSVQTANSQHGSVGWWYHVVIGYRIAGEVFVVDPAIEPAHPLKLEAWLDRMGDRQRMKVAFCSEGAYEPYTKCQGAVPASFESYLRAQELFLDLEWSRLEDLGRNPEQELGETPPWK